MTTFQTYDDVVFTKGPLGIESPRYIKYQEDGQGGSRPVEVASPVNTLFTNNDPEEFYKQRGKEFLSDYMNIFREEPSVSNLNFLNPLNWVNRKAQATIEEADRGVEEEFDTTTLSGKLLERRRLLKQLQQNN